MTFIKKTPNRIIVVLLYALIGILWITLSDNVLLYFIRDLEKMSTYQSYKGWAFVVITTSLLYLLLQWYDKGQQLSQLLLERKKKELETIIQEAPNPIILHNEEGNITMINKAWVDISGYTHEDIPTIDRWIETVYKDEKKQKKVKEHISQLYKITNKVNEGTFKFFNKNNKEIIWQFNSSPLGLIDGKRTIITSAMDITELKVRDSIIFEQSKLVSMGEMIGNIAHQWRQPLSVISTGATGLLVAKEFNTLTDQEFDKTCNAINDNVQYLSKTIDDFKNFIKGERKKVNFNLRENVNSFLHLLEGTIKNNEIQIVQDIKADINILGYPNELIQCFINIFNNAKDAFINTKEEKYIFISASIKNDYVVIVIKDNAGGIIKEALPKIFEPYFTTKHKSQGTGLGLRMTYNLIVDGMSGTIEAHNVTYEYNTTQYTGAEFVISLPFH
ncbi:MAG: PAS domain-containing sensor histidine kinase [Arcobacteraceae bacterium]